MFYRYSPLLGWNITNFLKNYVDGYIKHGDLVEGELAVANCTNGIQWILNMFGDCIDTNVKLAGFIIGCISLFLWLVPLIPQLYENYRRKRCEAFSFFFLLFWIVGDMCNMTGAVLTDQLPLQKVIGVYYICQDMILLSQYAYYSKIYPQRVQNNSVIVVPVLLFGIFGLSGSSSGHTVAKRSFISQDTVEMPPIFDGYSDLAGYIIGSFASFCYFAGRIPQIKTNYYRKSCEGLSPIMFYIIIVANLTYGFSVILETTGWLYMVRHLPWLAGSLGCCFFDCIILSQFYYYKKKNSVANRDEEVQSLLRDED